MSATKSEVEFYLENYPVPDGYVLVQRAPLMEMLDAGWQAMDEEGTADLIEAEDLAIAWWAMLQWAQKHYGEAQ